jgi:bifunctional non-homologous end joining protein LigD
VTSPLYAFDLLENDGSDLRRMPVETRRATLASLLKQSDVIRLSEHIVAEGPDVFAHACRLGAEGIVSKRLGSAYSSGLCHTWVKVKNPDAVAQQRERAARWNR